MQRWIERSDTPRRLNVTAAIAAATMAAVATLCLAPHVATAQPAERGQLTEPMQQSGQPLQARFEQANITHDGKLTREQANNGMPMVAAHFDDIDDAKAGYVTLPQIEEFMIKQAMARPGR